MQVDHQQFLKDGYIILRQLIPPERLDRLRLLAELMVDKAKARSAAERTPDQPLGSAWYDQGQPRVIMADVVDADTAELLEFGLEEDTLGVASQLMQEPCCNLSSSEITCSCLIEYGHTSWHRDSAATDQAPLLGLANDLMANDTGYIQWNIALYDDDVFWLVPGSHARPTTEAERRQLMKNPNAALDTGICADLKAGDGIAYCNLLMHWGSWYSSKMRRTIHLSHRAFANRMYTFSHHVYWDQDQSFMQYLSAESRSHYEQALQWYAEERNVIGGIFRGIVDNDPALFQDKLAQLHRGEKHRMTAVVLMARLADKVHALNTLKANGLSKEEQRREIKGNAPPDKFLYFDIAERFTFEETEILQRRFAKLNELLNQERDRVREHYTKVYAEIHPDAGPPDFETRALRHFHTNMPENFEVDDFIASWDS